MKRLVKYIQPKLRSVSSNIDPNYNFVDTVDTNTQTDIHTLINIDRVGLLTGYDYNFVRGKVLEQVITQGGFDNLTADEKYVAGKWICCTEAQALTVMTQEEFDTFAAALVDGAYASRETRRLNAKRQFGIEVVKGTLTYADSNQFDVDTEEMARAWVNANNPAFTNWITTGSGFIAQSYGTEARKQVLINYIISGSI